MTDIKTTELNNEREKRNFRVLEFYQDIINSYNNGVNLHSIENMINDDYKAFRTNKQSNIKSEKDYEYAELALSFFKTKKEFLEDYDDTRDTFYDKCLDQKDEFQTIIDSDVSIDNLEAMIETDFNKFDYNSTSNEFSETYNNPTATKSYRDKKIKKLAFNLIKKENN